MLRDHLEKLHHFIGCVREGSIRRYASKNRLSQSSVSKTIQILERDLETSLFHRSREGLKLTKAGEELLSLTETVLRSTDETDTKIRNSDGPRLRGCVTMGTYPSIAVYFVPQFLRELQKWQPDLSVNIVTASSADLAGMLANSAVDFVVSVDPPRRSSIGSDLLLKDTYSLYRSNSCPEKVSDLFTLPSARDSTGKTILNYLEDIRTPFRVSACSDFESAKAMVLSGIGVGILPDRVAGPAVAEGKLLLEKQYPGLTHFGNHTIAFSYRNARSEDHLLRCVRVHLRTALAT